MRGRGTGEARPEHHRLWQGRDDSARMGRGWRTGPDMRDFTPLLGLAGLWR